MRGMLSTEVQEEARNQIGREITLTELRLLPYIQYVMMNDQKLEPRKVNQSEREVLTHWREEGFVTGGAGEMTITKEFWVFMCSVLFIAYVDYPE